MSHPYTDRDAGWEILAGQDVSEGRFKTTRYMLVYNAKREKNKSAILVTPHPKRREWGIYAEGKSFEMQQLFDKLDTGLDA